MTAETKFGKRSSVCHVDESRNVNKFHRLSRLNSIVFERAWVDIKQINIRHENDSGCHLKLRTCGGLRCSKWGGSKVTTEKSTSLTLDLREWAHSTIFRLSVSHRKSSMWSFSSHTPPSRHIRQTQSFDSPSQLSKSNVNSFWRFEIESRLCLQVHFHSNLLRVINFRWFYWF